MEDTHADVIGKIKTDPIFALGFALDNNFQGIQARMAEKGISVATEQEAATKILELARNGASDFIRHFFNVAYDNTNTNYTGGYADFFVPNSIPPPNPATAPAGTPGLRTMSGMWAGLLTFIGGGLTTLGVTGTGGTGTGETPAQKAEREAKEKAAAEKKKRTMWAWIGGIVGTGLLILGVWYFFFKK